LTLRIEDRGLGFDAQQVRGAGLGLVSMRERARLIRAELTVESTPQRGSAVSVRAPLGPGACHENSRGNAAPH
jgi:signal transduction histidine kinase